MLNETLIDSIPYNSRSSAPYNTNACACCWSETGPFVAGTTPSRLPIYVCKTCATVLAAAFGWTSPEESVQASVLIEGQQAHIRAVEAELEQERLTKTVPLADVVDYFEKRAELRPNEPVPATQPAA